MESPSACCFSLATPSLALMLYAGGTTGSPKGAQLTQRNIVANTIQFAEWYAFEPGGEICISVIPMFHSGGMAGVMSAGVGPGHTLLKAGIFRKAGKALLGGSPDAHNLAIAKTLFNRNQAMNQHALDPLFDPTVWKALPEVARRLLARALLMCTSQHAGRPWAVTRGAAADGN